jgi:hypothetical protein
MFNLKSVKNATRFVVGAVATASDYVTNNSITEDVLVASISGVKKAVNAVKSIDVKAAKEKYMDYREASQCYFEQTVADVKAKRAEPKPISTEPELASVFTDMPTATLRLMLGYKMQCPLSDIPQLSREEMIVQLMSIAVAELEADTTE